MQFSSFRASRLMRYHVAVHVEVVLRLRFCETRIHVHFTLFLFPLFFLVQPWFEGSRMMEDIYLAIFDVLEISMTAQIKRNEVRG